MGRKIQDSILFLGNRDDVARLYQAMDVFVLPSRYEGLPVVAVEAQAAGLPCILSDRITKEIALSELATFEHIDHAASVWAEEVLLASKTSGRGRFGRALGDCFDISMQGSSLTKYYLAALAEEESL